MGSRSRKLVRLHSAAARPRKLAAQSARLCRSATQAAREFVEKRAQIRLRRKPGKAVPGGGGGEGQASARPSLNERRRPPGLIKQGRPDVDDIIQSVWAGIHPRKAQRTKIMTRCAAGAADDRFALRHSECACWKSGAERIRAGCHFPASLAMAGHGHERRAICANAHSAAAARAFATIGRHRSTSVREISRPRCGSRRSPCHRYR